MSFIFSVSNTICIDQSRSLWFPSAAGIAGGLTNLSKMPACNLMLLGAQRRTLSGFSSASLLPHTGYIYHCDVVQSLPPVSTYINLLQCSLFVHLNEDSVANACLPLCVFRTSGGRQLVWCLQNALWLPEWTVSMRVQLAR